MRRAYARNAARRNLPALGNEGGEQPHFFVIDIVDPVDAESAHLLAPEILFLACDRLVAAGGTLRSADWSSALGFCHVRYPFVSSATSRLGVSAGAGAGAAGAGCSGAGAPGSPGAAAGSPGTAGTPNGAAGAAT